MNLPVSVAACDTDRIRESRRIRMTLPVTVRFDPADPGASLTCRDISPSGAFLAADVLLAEGTDMYCEFALPDGRPVLASARVVRVATASDEPRGAGMGVAFVGLDDDARKRLLRLGLDCG